MLKWTTPLGSIMVLSGWIREMRSRADRGSDNHCRSEIFRLVYSGRIPASLMTFDHFRISDLIIAANASGELPVPSTPASANFDRSSGDASAFRVSALRVLMVVPGTFAGAIIPCHTVTSNPG